MRRTFSDDERWMLYRMAGGKCEQCQIELHGVFHADHIVPFSKGGITDVANGQILCEVCNLKKGNKMVTERQLPEWTMTLRWWQQEGFATWMGGTKHELIVATPGAGKTVFALRIAHHELQSGAAEQIIIIAPSDELRRQWVQEAAKVGINLTTNYDAAFELAPDYHGVVTTFSTIAKRQSNFSKAFRKYTSRKNTLAIIDEVHHLAEYLNWGEGAHDALSPCYRTLSISGTAFRSDNNRIPFIQYMTDASGKDICKAGFTYGYGDALRDGVVRPVYFQTFDGEVSWFTFDGEEMTVNFDAELPEHLAAQRMYYTLRADGGWLRSVLVEAHSKLLEIHREDPAAGGLITTRDVTHALQVAQVLESVTGKKPVIVTSKDVDAAGAIDRFRYSNDEWIVAVKMVSEGVDIKRLRVGVWATNIQTELFFRQVVGRVVRMTDQPEDQYAYMYIPKLEPLTTYAETMKQERKHAIEDVEGADQQEQGQSEGEDTDCLQMALTAFSESIGFKGALIHDDAQYTAEQLHEALHYCNQAGIVPSDNNVIVVARLLMMFGHQFIKEIVPQSTASTNPNKKVKTLEERKAEVRQNIKRLVRPIIEASNGTLAYNTINRMVNDAQGVMKIDMCSLEQLEERIQILVAWRKAWGNGTGRTFTVKGYLRSAVG